MEVKCWSEVSVDFLWATQRYSAEGRTLHNHCYVNLKSCIYLTCSTTPSKLCLAYLIIMSVLCWSEVLMAVAVKSTVSWDIKLRSSVKVNQSNYSSVVSWLVHPVSSRKPMRADWFFWLWLHGSISQKIEIFNSPTAVNAENVMRRKAFSLVGFWE